jgi:hypothetical protein
VNIRIVAAASAFMLLLPVTASFADDSQKTVVVMPVSPLPKDASPQTVEAETLVCREGRAPIGTRFKGPRICKTQRQWDEEMHEEQHNIAKNQIRGCLANGTCPR